MNIENITEELAFLPFWEAKLESRIIHSLRFGNNSESTLLTALVECMKRKFHFMYLALNYKINFLSLEFFTDTT